MSTFSWTCIVISLVFQGAVPVFQQRLMKAANADGIKNASMLAFVTSSLVAFAMLGVFVFIVGYSPPENWGKIQYHVMGAVALYAIANVCIFKSLMMITPALFGLIFTKRVIYVVAAAVIFLGEVMNSLKLLGIGVIMVGIVYAARRREEATGASPKVSLVKKESSEEQPKASRGAGIAYASVGTACFGSANAIDAHIVLSFSPTSYLLFRLILPALLIGAIGLLVWFKPRDLLNFPRQGRSKPLTGMAICVVVSSATFMMAFEDSHQLALLSGVHQLSLFFTIIFSAMINKQERRNFAAYILAAVVCLIGVALLRWG